jgi:hypothetical protein
MKAMSLNDFLSRINKDGDRIIGGGDIYIDGIDDKGNPARYKVNYTYKDTKSLAKFMVDLPCFWKMFPPGSATNLFEKVV